MSDDEPSRPDDMGGPTFEFVDGDLIVPSQIEHACEQIFANGDLEQQYNYLLYHFELDGTSMRARAYLDDISTVSIFPPHETGNSPLALREAPELREAVLSYLKRRYLRIQELSLTSGYMTIWTYDATVAP